MEVMTKDEFKTVVAKQINLFEVDKPVVTYEEVEFQDYGDDIYSIVFGVRDHPHLGDMPSVRTSKVIRHIWNPNSDEPGDFIGFETVNTIYMRRLGH